MCPSGESELLVDEGIEVRRRDEAHDEFVEEHSRKGMLKRRLRFRQQVLVSDMPFGEHGFPVGLARECTSPESSSVSAHLSVRQP